MILTFLPFSHLFSTLQRLCLGIKYRIKYRELQMHRRKLALSSKPSLEYLWVRVYESMSQRVSVVTQIRKMKLKFKIA